jgi:deoxyribodipyrimidine photo-lyase
MASGVPAVGRMQLHFFGLFNPVLQAQKFDPSGEYFRTWLPELRAVPDQYILTPWQMPPDVQANTQCMIGKHYPATLCGTCFRTSARVDAYSKNKKI